MSEQLVDEIRQFLRGVQSAQDDLAALYRRKRAALTAARAGELLQIAESETLLVQELQAQLARRREILRESALAGLPGDSIQHVVASLGAEARADLEPHVERARRTAGEVRRETWVHWIIAQRALCHYQNLLELIAHCGRKSPTYSRRPGQDHSGGGAILDASA